MLFPNLRTRRFGAMWRTFALAVVCSAALGLVLGNVAAHAVCYVACSECLCFRGAASGTHYKICESEKTVYRDQYWTDGAGSEEGRQILMFRECPGTPVCVGSGALDKLQCGGPPTGEYFCCEGGTSCVVY